MIYKPKPGSDEAIKQGCKCPVESNKHGAGLRTKAESIWTAYYVNPACKVHRPKAKKARR